MDFVGDLVGYVLTAFIVVMLARLVLDWLAVASVGPRWVRRARGLTHRATEPVIAPLRRRLRPLRAGGVAIDLAFTVVFIAALILRSVAFSL
jgi:YggT family protein